MRNTGAGGVTCRALDPPEERALAKAIPRLDRSRLSTLPIPVILSIVRDMRRIFSRLPTLLCATLALAPACAIAQAFPARGVTIVSPFAPGGPNDLIARTLATRFTESLGVAVVVENRGGAGGTVGTGVVARAAPDGHTLLLGGPSSLAIAPHLYAKLPYDSLRDFAPISNVALTPYVLAVNPRVPAKSLGDVIRIARSRPEALSFGSSGAGSVSHLAAEMLSATAKLQMVHVPYKGTVPSIAAMVGGDVDMMFADFSLIDALSRSGKLRLIAVAGRKRSAALPAVPTVIEAGFPDFVMEGRFGLLAPSGTHRETISRLNALVIAVIRAPEVRTRFAQLGYEPLGDSPEEFAALIRSDFERFGRLIRQLGLKAD